MAEKELSQQTKSAIANCIRSILLECVIKNQKPPQNADKQRPLADSTTASALSSSSSLCQGYFPLKEKPAFRPSEVSQGLYLGAMKDIVPPQQRKVLISRGVRVFVCCCAVVKSNLSSPSPSDDASEEPSRDCTAATLPSLVEVHCYSIHETSSAGAEKPSAVETKRVRTERYNGEWWAQTPKAFDDLCEWVDSHFTRFETSVCDKSLAGTSPTTTSSGIRDDEYREMIIRIPARDEVDFDFSDKSAPYMAVVPRLVGHLMTMAERTSDSSPSSLSTSSLACRTTASASLGGPEESLEESVAAEKRLSAARQRSFGIVIYCVAGKSRSVTILVASLVRQLVMSFGECLARTCSSDAVAATSTELSPLRTFVASSAQSNNGNASLLATLILDVVISYTQTRRMVAGPNPGFYQQLVDFTSGELRQVVERHADAIT